MTIKIEKGDYVVMANCAEANIEAYAGKIWEVITDPWKCGGSLVVKLEGFSGGFDIDCLVKLNREQLISFGYPCAP